VNVSKSRSEKLRSGVAAIAAAKSSTLIRAAPMLAAAASSHLYRLYRLMSEFKFSELLHGAQDSRSLAAMRSLQPLRPSTVPVNRLQCAEGPGR
jgi:hypothetical protein